MSKRKIVSVLHQLDTLPLPAKDKILSACPSPATSGDEARVINSRRPRRLKPLFAVGAAMILLVFGTAVYAIAAEAKEYNEAVTFFREYDLAEEGLTRSEIKAVYRDIITGSFRFDKTAEVIEQKVTKSSVGGYEILQEAPTPEDLERYWEFVTNYEKYIEHNPLRNSDGVIYRIRELTVFREDLGLEIFDQSVFEKYRDGALIWTAENIEFWIDSYVAFDGKVIIYGRSPTDPGEDDDRGAWVALIDQDGEVLWQTRLNNGSVYEDIAAILPSDEKIVVFSEADARYLCMSEFDLSGKITRTHITEIGPYQIGNTARLGDGYIISLRSEDGHARLIKVSCDGFITDAFSYESNDCRYFITDMIEYNDKIYLSAHSVPKLENEERDGGGRYEIAAVLNYIFDNQMTDITDDEVTRLMRANFSAVILVCDPISGIPQEFYSVEESIGGKLMIDESNQLIWNVESITHAFFSPMASSFSISSTNLVFRYTFDESGALLNQEKTKEFTRFYR